MKLKAEIYVYFERTNQLLSLLLLVSDVNQVSGSALFHEQDKIPSTVPLKFHQQCHCTHRIEDRLELRIGKYK